MPSLKGRGGISMIAHAVWLTQEIIALRTHVCIFVSIAVSEKQKDHRHLETNRKVRKTCWQSRFCVQLDEVTQNHAPQCDLQGLLVNSISTVHSRDVVPQMLYCCVQSPQAGGVVIYEPCDLPLKGSYRSVWNWHPQRYIYVLIVEFSNWGG
jgi:hypothetical protein